MAWQCYKRVNKKYWDLTVSGKFKLRCYPDSTAASLALYCSGFPDYHEMNFMARYLRSGDAFIDVGANIGLYTLLGASLVGSEGVVESFEPDPIAFDRLKENITANNLSNVTVHNVCVGSEQKAIKFIQGYDTINRIQTSIDSGIATVELPCVRLDQTLENKQYAMMKMDIEGAEPLALEGARELLTTHNPSVIQLEMNGKLHAYGFTEDEFEHWLKSLGYLVCVYDADRRELEFLPRPWERRRNVLAISENDLSFVNDRLSQRNDPGIYS